MPSKIRMVCFDFDGTLVDFSPFISSWDFLHDKFGVLESGEKIKKDFFDGKIDYLAWVELDSALWLQKKATKDLLVKNVLKAKRMKNSLEVLQALKSKGLKLAVVSGSLDFVLEAFFPKKLFDYPIIEKSFFSKDGLLERVESICGHNKREIVEELAFKEGLSLQEVAFVGDNFNDIEAIKTVGLGIAFNPGNSELEKHADFIIREKDFSKVLEVILKHA